MGKSAYLFATIAFGLMTGPAVAGARSDDSRAADECTDRKSQLAALKEEMKANKAVVVKPKHKRRYILM